MKKETKRSPISWIWEFAEGHRHLLLFSVCMAILGVACGILPYFLMGDVVKKLLAGDKEFGAFMGLLLGIGLLWLGNAVFSAISTSISHKATFSVLANIQKRLCSKLSHQPLGYVLDTPSGSLKNVIVERVNSMETTMAHVIPEFTSNLLVPIGLFVYLFILDWRMGIATLATVPLGVIAFSLMMIGYEESFNNTIVKTKALNDTAVEYINGIEVIKAFGKAESSYEKFVVAAKEGADCFIDWMRRCIVQQSSAMVVLPATMVAVLPIGGLLYSKGNLSAEVFVQVILLSVGLLASLISLGGYFDDIGKLGAIMKEVTDILEQPDLVRPEKSKKLPEKYNISLKNVTFGYHEKEVLHGVNMELLEGTVNAFVGPSGSGKSTIAKLIASLWDVNGGSIEIGGVDIRALSSKDYHKFIAYVSQDNFLFDETIMENIRMGKEGATDDEVVDAAKRSGCHEFIMSLENGYETKVGGAGGHLSGGERQRICIARAMLKDAPIVILDEATAYTDPENEALIQSCVAKLVKGKTLIVIAHRLSTIIDSDRIFVIENGEVLDRGTHEELLAKGELYAAMWNSHIATKDTAKGGVAYV